MWCVSMSVVRARCIGWLLDAVGGRLVSKTRHTARAQNYISTTCSLHNTNIITCHAEFSKIHSQNVYIFNIQHNFTNINSLSLNCPSPLRCIVQSCRGPILYQTTSLEILGYHQWITLVKKQETQKLKFF